MCNLKACNYTWPLNKRITKGVTNQKLFVKSHNCQWTDDLTKLHKYHVMPYLNNALKATFPFFTKSLNLTSLARPITARGSLHVIVFIYKNKTNKSCPGDILRLIKL